MTGSAIVIRMKEQISDDDFDNRSVELEQQMSILLTEMTVKRFFELKFTCKMRNLLIMRENLIFPPLCEMLRLMMLFIELSTKW